MTGRILVVYPSQDRINTVGGLPVILDCSRRFLDMFKTLCPPIFMLFARMITPNPLEPMCDSFGFNFCIFILPTCNRTKKPLMIFIHLLLPSTAKPGSSKCSKHLWNIFCLYCCSKSRRPVKRSYEIYLRFYHVTGLTKVATRTKALV